jgi:hypothetical protein
MAINMISAQISIAYKACPLTPDMRKRAFEQGQGRSKVGFKKDDFI